MTSNLYEFLSVVTLVICATGFVGALRYAISVFERPGKDETQQEQL